MDGQKMRMSDSGNGRSISPLSPFPPVQSQPMNQQEETEETEGDEATLRDAIATVTRVRPCLHLIRIFSDQDVPSSVGAACL